MTTTDGPTCRVPALAQASQLIRSTRLRAPAAAVSAVVSNRVGSSLRKPHGQASFRHFSGMGPWTRKSVGDSHLTARPPLSGACGYCGPQQHWPEAWRLRKRLAPLCARSANRTLTHVQNDEVARPRTGRNDWAGLGVPRRPSACAVSGKRATSCGRSHAGRRCLIVIWFLSLTTRKARLRTTPSTGCACPALASVWSPRRGRGDGA